MDTAGSRSNHRSAPPTHATHHAHPVSAAPLLGSILGIAVCGVGGGLRRPGPPVTGLGVDGVPGAILAAVTGMVVATALWAGGILAAAGAGPGAVSGHLRADIEDDRRPADRRLRRRDDARADQRGHARLRRRAGVRGAGARSSAAASRRAGSRSDARSASPTARSGRATACTSRCGRTSGTHTVHHAPDGPRSARRSRGCVQPRIEPEVVFELDGAGAGHGRRAGACSTRIEWIAPGFEIVQSALSRTGSSPRPTARRRSACIGALVVGAPRRARPTATARRCAAALPAFDAHAAPRRRA